jgi:flavin reductase (DIM6/NTAB) family NADH-FMN oxidoreductase RutF
MPIFDLNALDKLELAHKVNLMNALPGAKSVNLIGSIDEQRRENLAIFSTVIHLGSNPGLLGFIHRPIRYYGHTLKNIQSNRYYTINVVNSDIQSQAHQTSEKYPAEESEFLATGLSCIYHDNFKAPFVKESKIKCGLEVSSILPIEENGTFLVIGKVELVIIDDQFIQDNNAFDHISAKTLSVYNFDDYSLLSKI